MGGLIEHYRPSLKSETIDCQYGTIPVLEWLQKEKTRIERTPGRFAQIKETVSRASLWVNDIRDSRYNEERKNARRTKS